MSEERHDGLFDTIDRRTFVQGVSAAGLAAGIGLPTISGSAAAAPLSRRSDAATARNSATTRLVDEDASELTQISDDGQTTGSGYSSTIDFDRSASIERAMYTKCREGDNRNPAMSTYVDLAIDYDDPQLDALPTGGGRAHVEPNAAIQYATEGIDPHMGVMPPAAGYGTDELAASMLTLYWMAHFRDVPLLNIGNQDAWLDYFGELGSVYNDDYPWVNWNHTLRGGFWGTHDGPYINQFYLHEVEFGNMQFEPTVKAAPQRDFAINDTDEPGLPKADFLPPATTGGPSATQMRDGYTGGAEPGGNNPKPRYIARDASERWITTGRDLATLVRDEPSYQHYYMAALQLASWGAQPSTSDGEALPPNQGDAGSPAGGMRYVNYGGAGLIDLLARVAKNALNAAWYQKWLVHLRQRPESIGVDLENGNPALQSGETQALPPALLNSQTRSGYAVSRIQNDTGFAYLPQAYPEGAPAHPAYPSGHSTIAGACVTVLKALFDDGQVGSLPAFTRSSNPLETREQPDTIGGSRNNYTNFDGALTIHGELNKLAENVGVGRMWAGVHYWDDHVWGARLGEQIGVATLIDAFNDDADIDGGTVPYHFQYTGLDGVQRQTTIGDYTAADGSTRPGLESLRQDSASRPFTVASRPSSS